MTYFKQIKELLDGSKTQTRRIAKMDEFVGYRMKSADGTMNWARVCEMSIQEWAAVQANFEIVRVHTWADRLKWEVGRTYPVMPKRGKPALWIGPDGELIYDRFEVYNNLWNMCIIPDDWPTEKGPMPDWYADQQLRAAGYWPVRYQLDSIRLERVQDISEEDAKAEGVQPQPPLYSVDGDYAYRHGYELLWGQINARKGARWEDNPWVWVQDFHVLTREEVQT